MLCTRQHLNALTIFFCFSTWISCRSRNDVFNPCAIFSLRVLTLGLNVNFICTSATKAFARLSVNSRALPAVRSLAMRTLAKLSLGANVNSCSKLTDGRRCCLSIDSPSSLLLLTIPSLARLQVFVAFSDAYSSHVRLAICNPCLLWGKTASVFPRQ